MSGSLREKRVPPAAPPAIRSGVDFQKIPMRKVMAMLSALAKDSVQWCLADGPPLDPKVVAVLGEPLGFDRPAKRGGKSLSFSDRRVLFNRWLARKRRRFLRRFLPEIQALFGKPESEVEFRWLVEQSKTGKLSPKARRLLLEKEVTAGLKGRFLLPEPMWDLLAEAVFNHPNLKSTVVQGVQAFFREKVVFDLNAQSPIRLAPQCFWLLIALVPYRRPGFWLRLSRRYRRNLKSLNRLKAMAKKQADQFRWAGFWDQWIIFEAVRKLQDSDAPVDPEIKAVLQTLPLLRVLSGKSESGASVEDWESESGWAHPLWKDQRPAWVLPYLDLMTEQTPSQTVKRGFIARKVGGLFTIFRKPRRSREGLP